MQEMEERWRERREDEKVVKKWWGRACVMWGGEPNLRTAMTKGQAWELEDSLKVPML